LQPVRPDQVVDFNVLYKTHCSGCHGADGTWGPAPPLNDHLFQALIGDDELRRVIEQGRALASDGGGRLMPAFADSQGGPLNSVQVDALIRGMRDAWHKPLGPEDKEIPPYRVGVTMGDPVRGAKVFGSNCASCHGAQGKGGRRGAVNDPAFLALISDQALRRIIITGRSDLGMPNYRHPPAQGKTLTAQDVTDLVALLASWRTLALDR
jgi:mono/diheme cytochrome c family protein